jgi:MFS transporter, DHA1 family, multidrug resistance protein
MTRRYLSSDSRLLLALLAALVALGPLSIDMYLPALPAMREAFNTDAGQMQLTISVYLLGFSLFHLLCGPLADRFGRKPILVGGSLLFAAACIGCSLSTTVEGLLLCRFAQGVGACVGPTLARAITRDLFGPNRAARALSLIAMLMALAPAVAPALGGLMLLVLPWPSIFVSLSIYACIIVLLTWLYIPESLPQRQSLRPAIIGANYLQLLAHPLYLSVTLASGLAYAALLTYVSSSSFIYIEMLGVPVEYFGLIFLTTVLGYMLGSALSARLASSKSSEYLILSGSTVALVATLCLWLASELYPDSVSAIMLPMALYTSALGLMLPHAMAIAMRPFAHIAGTASALLGFIQMALAAGASAVVAMILDNSARPMVVTMVLISFLSLALTLRVCKRTKADPQ